MGPWLRLLFLAGSMVWTLLLLLSPRRRLPVWTRIGQGTLPVYLLHGFVQRLAVKEKLFRNGDALNALLALALTWGLLLLSSRPVCGLFRLLFHGSPGGGKQAKTRGNPL